MTAIDPPAPRAPALPSSRDGSSLVPRLIQPLQAISVLALLVAAATAIPTPGDDPTRWAPAAIWGVSAIGVGLLWWIRARSASRRRRGLLSGAAAMFLIPAVLLGTIGLALPVLLVALALVVVDVSRTVGVVVVLLAGLATVGLHLAAGAPPLIAVVEAFSVAVLLVVGVALGSALGAAEAAHQQDRRLVADRDRAVQQLGRAMAQQRRSAETEKELLLADERARSARDLHDGLGHRLTVIALSLEYARRARHDAPEDAWAEVGTAEATSREALEEMRMWVRALSPVRDSDATGAAAIDAIAESFRGTGLVVETAVDHRMEVDDQASLLVYRAVQEGLTNALRHARAQRVRITLQAGGQLARLRICSDLGPGPRATVPQGPFTPAFGLQGLAERAHERNGGIRAGRSGDEAALEVWFRPKVPVDVPDGDRR